MHTTLYTYDQVEEGKDRKVYTWLQVREDIQQLWGFSETVEREVFLLLISISGLGPNTARLILSGMTADECKQAILSDNELAFRQVKGVGPKTAKRVIIELKDKILKTGTEPISIKTSPDRHAAMAEALAALVTLGFAKTQAERAIQQVLKELGSDVTTEILVRQSLRLLSAGADIIENRLYRYTTRLT